MLLIGVVQLKASFDLLHDYWSWPLFVIVPLLGVLVLINGWVLISTGGFFGAWLAWGCPVWMAIAISVPGFVVSIALLRGVAPNLEMSMFYRGVRRPGRAVGGGAASPEFEHRGAEDAEKERR